MDSVFARKRYDLISSGVIGARLDLVGRASVQARRASEKAGRASDQAG